MGQYEVRTKEVTEWKKSMRRSGIKFNGAMRETTREHIMKWELQPRTDGMTNCHSNSIIMMMYPQFDGYCLATGVWRKEEDPYHSHSFLLNPDTLHVTDPTCYPKVIGCSLKEYVENVGNRFRRFRLFPRAKALYWLRKTGWMGVWDKFTNDLEDAYSDDTTKKDNGYLFLDEEDDIIHQMVGE